jgi:RNA polymerase sigma-70 factor (ECF subfamily)
VQDTFVKTWSYLVKKGKIDGMKAFLYHILNNLIVDEYRKRKYKHASLDVLLEDGYMPSVDESEHLFNTLDGKVIIPLIKDLPKIYQKVVHMRYVQEMTIKEICLITGKTENTISVRIHRGVQKLKILYNPANNPAHNIQ